MGLVVGLHLASLDRRSENIIIEPIVIPELELRNVKMQILFADVMECADDPALEDAPEALNRLSMNRTDNVLMLGMINGAVIKFLAKVIVANPLIGAEQANFVRHSFVDERLQGLLLHILNNASDYVSLATDRANYNRFAGSGRAGLAIALFPMAIFGFAANECFVNFNDAAKLRFRLNQRGSDFVSHEPSGFDRTETHVAAKLTRAHSLFASQYQVSDLEPVAERFVGIFEYGPCDAGEAIAVLGAGFALPMIARRQLIDFDVAATRAIHTLGPASSDQIGPASIFVANRKHGVELSGCKLMDRLWAFHGFSSFVGGYNHV
jgi:hypothetical protein